MYQIRNWLHAPVHAGLFGSMTLMVALSGCSDDGETQPPIDAPISIDTSIMVDASIPDATIPDAIPPDAAIAPRFRTPVALPDDVIAQLSLELLGSPAATKEVNCGDCHGLTRQALRQWRALSDASITTCLTDLQVTSSESARSMIDCLRADPNDPGSTFATSRLGIYSTAAHLDWFSFTFWRAYGEGGDWETEFDAFQNRVLMPMGAHEPYTQEQFDIIAEWFFRGLPLLDDLLPEDPPPSECTTGISADMSIHVDSMRQSGWRAVNAENLLLMHGCDGATDPMACLASYPRAADTGYGENWDVIPGTTVRVLRANGYRSSYWTRSSADGRFVAHGRTSGGGGGNAAFVDLLSDQVIGGQANYDPGFFPDNSGFMFQGSNAYFCPHSVLTSAVGGISFNEPGCTTASQVGLYQHVGAALGGGDYWTVNSLWVGDNGGIGVTGSDPSTNFGNSAQVKLTPMINDGSGYIQQDSVYLNSPYEGDTVISPSAQLLVSRVAGPGKQLGFVVRKIIATPTVDGYNITTPEVARYCEQNGGKPAFSYDERWLVTHHYIQDEDAVDLGFNNADDPAFQSYKQNGAANLYLIDMLTGERHRITNMAPGQYALFPHFRSDGWIYAIVRTIGTNTEYIMASDAALFLESTP